MSALNDDQLELVEQEQEIATRVQQALSRAREQRPPDVAEQAARRLRELQELTASAAAEDLPELLLQMSVAEQLLQREPKAPLPDALTPYLAHLCVHEGGRERHYLLGSHTFVDLELSVRIVDWRVAPVAKIFYGYREGDDYEQELPGRIAEGVVRARRIVVFERGRLTRISTDHETLQCDPERGWYRVERAELAVGGAGVAAQSMALGTGAGARERSGVPDISALLDATQFDAISAPAETPLLVLGSAGSGKTTVALHRLARLHTVHRQRFPLNGSQVVVPEPGLMRLTQRLLQPLLLGDDPQQGLVRTLDAWAEHLARLVFSKQKLRLSSEAPGVVVSLKRHPALYRALTTRFSGRKLKPRSLRQWRRRLGELLTDHEFLTEVVRAAGPDLPQSAVAETIRHTLNLLREPFERELATITDPTLRRALDGRGIAEGTPEALAGSVDIEDLPILLHLKALEGALPSPRVAQLVLDEAEDFSLFELSVLGRQLNDDHSVTLAGDEAQQTASSFAGWDAVLSTLGLQRPAVCRLAISYRCPRAVVELAQYVLGDLAPERPARAAHDGAPVGYYRLPTLAQATLFLADALGGLLAREPYACIAVIAHDAAAAEALFVALSRVPDTRLVLDGEFSFEAGVDVTCVDAVKGLEFDYVIVPDATLSAYPNTADARRRLHVAVTRAAHQLWLIAAGTPTPILAERFEARAQAERTASSLRRLASSNTEPTERGGPETTSTPD